ncbi:MAG: hypothetical protein LPJ95_07510, partial [Paracoccaceae bacterium]|nr:hypothetical protein [Paracoccaceae bacterium]
DDRFRNSENLWLSLCAQSNLIWTERQLDGIPTDLAEMTAILREALRRTLDGAPHSAMIVLTHLVWQLLGPEGRGPFRSAFGPFVSSNGRDVMRRFVDGLDEPLRSALIQAPGTELREILAPELRQRMAAFIASGG